MQIFSQKMVENLISDLLDLAKLNSSHFLINFEYFNLMETIYGAFEVMKYNSVMKKVTLRAILNNEDHLEFLKEIEGDSNRFMQIFLNFISNSIKFTPDYAALVEIEIKVVDFQNLLSQRKMVKMERRIQNNLQSVDDLEKYQENMNQDKLKKMAETIRSSEVESS